VSAQVAPFGEWRSPITADLIVQGTIGIGGVAVDGAELYWLEARPTEGGRNVLVRLGPQGPLDVTPPPFNVRSRVHEYGGGAFHVAQGTVWFSNFADGRLYRVRPGEVPEPLTALAGDRRYADFFHDAQRRRLIGVREEHAGDQVTNAIVAIDAESGDETVLVSGADFYANPRLSPDGTRLCWICWNFPDMPWDGTELWVAEISPDGGLGGAQRVAGSRDESIFQPEWSPAGVLHFVSDRSDWWNLYRVIDGEIEALCPMEAEFGRPQWVFGMATYAFAVDGTIWCTYTCAGTWHLARLYADTGALVDVALPFTELSAPCPQGDGLLMVVASPTEPAALIRLAPESSTFTVLRRSSQLEIDPGYLSVPKSVSYPSAGGRTAHAFYYPPANRDFTAPDGAKPPLLVRSHGGPTAATASALNLRIQYWTSRGWAVLDVNYGGSTGYGRPYRRLLDGAWGLVDVEDCEAGARFLVEQGLADAAQLAIDGGSAGGYTTLSALTFGNTFKAGASFYGVSDLETLATDTHKFEARYLDRLVGPYPERRDLYVERSPIHHTDRLACPAIFLQGLEDRVVPPSQAERMVEALRSRGLPVAYIAFEGEQHGFRRAENIKRALESEYYFFSRVFGIEPAENPQPVTIENLG